MPAIDTQSLSPAQQQPAGADHEDLARLLIAALMIFGYFGTVLLFHLVKGFLVETAQTQVVGGLQVILGTIVGWWFVSSSGSARKDKLPKQ